jgi:hypothetical protein
LIKHKIYLKKIENYSFLKVSLLTQIVEMTRLEERVSNILLWVPKEICYIITDYSITNYKTYKVWKECEMAKCYNILASFIFNDKIYFAEYDKYTKTELQMYDIIKNEIKNYGISYRGISGINICDNKIYISLDSSIVSYDLLTLCRDGMINVRKKIKDFVIHDDKFYYNHFPDDNNIYKTYIIDGNTEKNFHEINKSNEGFCKHNNYLYKTVTDNKSINIKVISSNGEEIRNILLENVNKEDLNELNHKKLIINETNIYLLIGKKIYCFNPIGKFSYKIDINSLFGDPYFNINEIEYITVEVNKEYIYIIIADKIITLIQEE